MRALLGAALLALADAASPCLGEFSTCANGACALIEDQCSSCTAGQYACPLSTTCINDPSGWAACPGLRGTHYDNTLSVSARLDYLFAPARGWTAADYISQMTDNASSILRLGIPAYTWLNDDQHGRVFFCLVVLWWL